LGSVIVLMHPAGQSFVPVGHWQTPPEQTWSVGQTVPQLPQFAWAIWVFTQRAAAEPAPAPAPAPQQTSPPGQASPSEPQIGLQVPLTQVWPAGQAVPQLPQFCGSLVVLMHAP
jgi:hypothetical protein